MIVQPTFLIPPEIEEGLLSGDYVRYGGVVRDTLGRLVQHLPEISAPSTDEEGLARAVFNLKKSWVVIAAGTLTAAAVGAVAVAVVRKRAQVAGSELPESVKNFNDALRVYLEAVRSGNLDAAVIEQLISSLEAIKEYAESGRITVDFSTDQSETLVQLVVNYTRELAEANSVDLDETEKLAPVSEGGVVVDLRSHLEMQRRIFTEAA